MALNPKEVSELLTTMKSVLEIWMKVKLAFQKAFGKGEIGNEQERAFLDLKSELSRQFKNVASRLPKDLQFDPDVMMDMMKSAISMTHLQNMPVQDKRNLFSNWHKVYVKMTRTLGALEVINEGYYPSLHREMLKTKKGVKTAGLQNQPASRAVK